MADCRDLGKVGCLTLAEAGEAALLGWCQWRLIFGDRPQGAWRCRLFDFGRGGRCSFTSLAAVECDFCQCTTGSLPLSFFGLWFAQKYPLQKISVGLEKYQLIFS